MTPHLLRYAALAMAAALSAVVACTDVENPDLGPGASAGGDAGSGGPSDLPPNGGDDSTPDAGGHVTDPHIDAVVEADTATNAGNDARTDGHMNNGPDSGPTDPDGRLDTDAGHRTLPICIWDETNWDECTWAN